MGARIITIDINDKRLDLAKSIGADHVVNPEKTDVVEEVKKFTFGEGASVGVDCTAHPEARINMMKCAKTWGRVAFVGEGNETTFDVSPMIGHKQLKVIGSWVYSIPTMMELVEYVSRYEIPLEELLVTDRYKLDDAPAAFESFCAGHTAGKGMFTWD